MFLINREENRLSALKECTFSELGFKERDHLQEWLANNPEAFGEELLIIQKEFDGFNNTNERLDLLALDKQGNLVIIENKLDDSGRDVTWQLLKYASYCSSLTKEQIKSIYQEYLDKYKTGERAVDNLKDFYENRDYEDLLINKGMTQRLILVAGSFRREVTSTVLWLLNYKLRIQCFKVTPFSLPDDTLFLTVEQIIPVRDTEEYMINMAEKNQAELSSEQETAGRHLLRLEFWRLLLDEMNIRSEHFKNISPSRDHWLSYGSGFSGIIYNFLVTRNYVGVEFLISRSTTEENNFIFDLLYEQRESIESNFGNELIWDRRDGKKSCGIKFQRNDLGFYEKESWPEIIEFLVPTMIEFIATFSEWIPQIRQDLFTWLKEGIK